ncbi:MAG: ABC transporter ATP-binding protein [Acidimicrobiales bacterium]
MTKRLSVEGVTVRYGATVALAAVDLAVEEGEIVAVLGPSGSGKSTLLRAVAGLQPVAAGRVLVAGQDLAGVPPHRRGVGLMFQDHALFPHRDVAANIGFGLRMQGRHATDIAARVEELLGLVDLGGFGHRGVQSLSGGEQQRVALARALAPRPAVLLLDEPLGALDRTLRERLVAELRSLFSDLGLTVVAVTHDQGEAFTLADRVVVMDRGSILQADAPALLWERPATRRVAELLGFTNIVDAVVEAGRASTPWGQVALGSAPPGLTTILIRPAGVRISAAADPAAVVRGTAVSCTFLGDRTMVRVAVDHALALDALVGTVDAPQVGEQVGVSLLDGAAVPLGS